MATTHTYLIRYLLFPGEFIQIKSRILLQKAVKNRIKQTPNNETYIVNLIDLKVKVRL